MNTEQETTKYEDTLRALLTDALEVFAQASRAVEPQNIRSWAEFSAPKLRDHLREAVAKDPGLLEELGLEQVGWQEQNLGVVTDGCLRRESDMVMGGGDDQRARPVFRVRPDA